MWQLVIQEEIEPYQTFQDIFTGHAWDFQSKILYAPVKLCQQSKPSRVKQGFLQPLPIPDRDWESLSMDFIMGLPRTARGNDAVQTFVHRLTKYVHLIPTTSNIGAEDTALLYLNHIFAIHGLGKSIISDRDPRFTASFFKEKFDRLGCKLQMSTANHPQTDGQTERVYRVV